MNDFSAMIWIEIKKAIRSRMPIWTALGSMLMPFGIAFLIFVSKNPGISQKLGLISAKANLFAYSATDWSGYLSMLGQLLAAGGFFFFVLVVSWIFGREFVDGTLKDMLAVPVSRNSILLAKFCVAAIWSIGLSALILLVSLAMGAVLKLPGGSLSVILRGSLMAGIAAGLVIASTLPFALFASLGRGYLLPLGIAVLTLMLTNLAVIAGWGEIFPWAVPGLFAQAKSPLPGVSYWILVLTSLGGMIATMVQWKYADQS